MNRFLYFLLGITFLAAAHLPAQESNVRTIEPADHGRALINPQMGWTMHFYSNIITNYGSSKRKNAWGDGSLLLQAVEEYHASYMSIHWWPRILLNENRDIIEKINRRIGYRIHLKKAAFPQQIRLGGPFTITSTWANTGVAPCYPGGFIAFTLKDQEGGIVAAFCDESFNVRDLSVGQQGKAPVKTIASTFAVALKTYGFAPITQPGTYDLYASVGMRDGTPVIALPHENDDGHRRYKLGTIRLLPSN